MGELRAFLSVPFLALTATATVDTQDRIKDSLNLYQPFVLVAIPNKTNVKYNVATLNTGNPALIFSKLVDDLKKNKYGAERIIIFCRTMSLLRTLYAYVDDSFPDYFNFLDKPYARFHSRTSDIVKKHIIDSFADPSGNVRLLMATVAFGMGIDCKGLYKVIHFGPPSSLNAYFQESGRVGRDGLKSEAILVKYKGYSKSSNIEKDMKEYCTNSVVCRRKLLLRIYGEAPPKVMPPHSCCDICQIKCDCGDCPIDEFFQGLSIEEDEIENSFGDEDLKSTSSENSFSSEVDEQ